MPENDNKYPMEDVRHLPRKDFIPKEFYNSSNYKYLSDQIKGFNKLPENIRDQKSPPGVFRLSFTNDVSEKLSTLYDGRCAFCETKIEPNEVGIYRFRPPLNLHPLAKEEDSRTYLWLAFNWDNLFPICPNCLPQEQQYFPMKKEGAHRVDHNKINYLDFPHNLDHEGRDTPEFEKIKKLLTEEEHSFWNPEENFFWREAIPAYQGSIHVRDPKNPSSATIDHFKLNRKDLCKHRLKSLKDFHQKLAKSNYQNRFLYSLEYIRKNCEYPFFILLTLKDIAYQFSNYMKKTQQQCESLDSNSFVLEDIINWSPQKLLDHYLSADRTTLLDEKEFSDFEKVYLNWKTDNTDERFIYKGTEIDYKKWRGFSDKDTAVRKQYDRLTSLDIKQFKTLGNVTLSNLDEFHLEDAKSLLHFSDQSLVDNDGENNRKIEKSEKIDIIADVPQAPCMLLLGENATGKSSILSSIALSLTNDKEFEFLS